MIHALFKLLNYLCFYLLYFPHGAPLNVFVHIFMKDWYIIVLLNILKHSLVYGFSG